MEETNQLQRKAPCAPFVLCYRYMYPRKKTSRMTTLQDQITRATNRLAQLKARDILKQQRETAKAKEQSRRADAHRKIELGGLVIAAGAEDLDSAELVGVLLAHLDSRGTGDGGGLFFAQQARERGIAHLQERETARNAARRR